MYPFGSQGMSAATARAERSEGLGFPRDCITPVATACVSSLGTRTHTLQLDAFVGDLSAVSVVGVLAICC